MLNNKIFSVLTIERNSENQSQMEKLQNQINPTVVVRVVEDEDCILGPCVYALKDENSNNFNVLEQESIDSKTFLQFAFFDWNGKKITVDIPDYRTKNINVNYIYLEQNATNPGIYILSSGNSKLIQIVPAGKYRIEPQ